jgi:hypothetical protein
VARALPQLAQLAARLPAGFTAGTTILATKPLLKAIGFTGLDQRFGPADGTINLSNQFPFDFDNSDGVGAGLFDLESILVHEIGHALGFISNADGPEQAPNQPRRIPLMPLDLFRFRTADRPLTQELFTTAPRSVEPIMAAVFGDVAHSFGFSTGRTGDGRQASHWKADELTGIQIGVMDPTLSPGTIGSITSADLRALDLIGYDIAVAEALPVVSIATVNGRAALANAVIPANAPVSFSAQATDADGLGSPVLAASGNRRPISFMWSAPGAQATPVQSALAQTFTATFPLPAGGATQTVPISVNAFDTLGDRSSAQLPVRVSNAPAVRVTVNGVEPVGSVEARSGVTLNLQATASDADGLGFPVFAAFGFTGNIVFQWSFGGGIVPNPLFTFSGNPPVTFTLQPNETARTFTVSVTVTDALGLATTRSVSVLVQR